MGEPVYVISSWPASATHVSCIEDAADVAGFGVKAYRNQKSARVLLENWVIEEALERLGDRRLSRDEQVQVLAAVRFPKKMKWPDWWEPHLRTRGKGWRAPRNASKSDEKKEHAVIRVSLADSLAAHHRERRLREEIEYARKYRSMSRKDQALFREPFTGIAADLSGK